MKTKITLKRQDLLDYLSNAPESGMGYQNVEISLADGKMIDGFVHNGSELTVEGMIVEGNINSIKVR